MILSGWVYVNIFGKVNCLPQNQRELKRKEVLTMKQLKMRVVIRDPNVDAWSWKSSLEFVGFWKGRGLPQNPTNCEEPPYSVDWPDFVAVVDDDDYDDDYNFHQRVGRQLRTEHVELYSIGSMTKWRRVWVVSTKSDCRHLEWKRINAKMQTETCILFSPSIKQSTSHLKKNMLNHIGTKREDVGLRKHWVRVAIDYSFFNYLTACFLRVREFRVSNIWLAHDWK